MIEEDVRDAIIGMIPTSYTVDTVTYSIAAGNLEILYADQWIEALFPCIVCSWGPLRSPLTGAIADWAYVTDVLIVKIESDTKDPDGTPQSGDEIGGERLARSILKDLLYSIENNWNTTLQTYSPKMSVGYPIVNIQPSARLVAEDKFVYGYLANIPIQYGLVRSA